VREAAILFESGTYQNCDAVVLVEAPLDQRVRRVMDRSGLTEAEVRQRIARQWPDAQKRALTTPRDFLLDNSGSESQLRDQVAAVDAELRRR
jgi:dephospho-CoA kinase